MRQEGLLPNPERVTDGDLRALVRQRIISLRDIAASAEGPPPLPPLLPQAGEECHPGDAPPEPNLVCAPSGEWRETKALIANAQKGDILLVAACSFIGNLLRQVEPIQHYSHEAIMTRNFADLSHSTASEDRLQDPDLQIGFLRSDGVRTEVMKYVWPGVLHQSVGDAFLGVKFGKYLIDAFDPDPIRCDGDPVITDALVVRPPLDAPPEIRADLHRAADIARSLSAHYRFFAYSQANVAFSTLFNAPQDDTPATVSSQFIWWALKLAELNLEGVRLEVKDRVRRSDVHFGGAEVDPQTMDGLYFYREDERRDAAQWLHDFTAGKVRAEAGTFGEFAFDAPDNYGDQVTNCFAFDFCGKDDTATICRDFGDNLPDDFDPRCCEPQPPVPGPNDPPPPVCEAKDSNAWENPGDGRAVSPDNFLFWDQPAGTRGAELLEDGVYGDFERMIYRENERVPVYRWVPGVGFGAVQGRVVEEGTQACQLDDECPTGDVCADQTCKRACTGDADCDTGAFCWLPDPSATDGFCARPVSGATVLFEAAAPDTVRTTEADGRFPQYSQVPASAQELEIRARLVTDPDPDHVGDETVVMGKTTFTLDSREIKNVTIVLRPTNPTLRTVTAQGSVNMIDCDCDSANERGTRSFFISCSVSPDNPVSGFGVSQSNICVDEVGIEISGECLLLAGEQDRTVRIQGFARFFEGPEDSCGGTEEEDSFFFQADLPPAELQEAGRRFSLNMAGGLRHEDVCVYALYVQDCDDEAWGMASSTGVNEIQF